MNYSGSSTTIVQDNQSSGRGRGNVLPAWMTRPPNGQHIMQQHQQHQAGGQNGYPLFYQQQPQLNFPQQQAWPMQQPLHNANSAPQPLNFPIHNTQMTPFHFPQYNPNPQGQNMGHRPTAIPPPPPPPPPVAVPPPPPPMESRPPPPPPPRKPETKEKDWALDMFLSVYQSKKKKKKRRLEININSDNKEKVLPPPQASNPATNGFKDSPYQDWTNCLDKKEDIENKAGKKNEYVSAISALTLLSQRWGKSGDDLEGEKNLSAATEPVEKMDTLSSDSETESDVEEGEIPEDELADNGVSGIEVEKDREDSEIQKHKEKKAFLSDPHRALENVGTSVTDLTTLDNEIRQESTPFNPEVIDLTCAVASADNEMVTPQTTGTLLDVPVKLPQLPVQELTRIVTPKEHNQAMVDIPMPQFVTSSVSVIKNKPSTLDPSSIIALTAKRKRVILSIRKAALEKARAKLLLAQKKRNEITLLASQKGSFGETNMITSESDSEGASGDNTPVVTKNFSLSRKSSRLDPKLPDITAMSQRIYIQGISKSGLAEKIRIQPEEPYTPQEFSIEIIDSNTSDAEIDEPMKKPDNFQIPESKQKSDALRMNLLKLKKILAAKMEHQKQKLKIVGDTSKATNTRTIITSQENELGTAITKEISKPNDNAKGLRKRQRELKNEIDLSHLRNLVSKQQTLLASHTQKVQESSEELALCDIEIDAEEKSVREAEEKLLELENRKAIMEGMLVRSTRKLVSARQRLNDHKTRKDPIKKTPSFLSRSNSKRRGQAADFF